MSGKSPARPGVRLGGAEIVKGGAEVTFRSTGPAVEAGGDAFPAISEDQAAQSGLFRPRLIEFGETRQETTVSVRPHVREELVVGRTAERRVQRIEETLRRTEVEVEDLSRRGDGEKS